jgi:glycosyltransferase involved in cell wall biosynthesis
MNKLVSVIIPTYNYRRYVTDAVESALAQTYRPIEVIVADDGSTDGTGEELRRFGDQIRYLHQENRGLPAARNLGIRTATGEYLAFLDSDDLWDPTKLEKQMAVIEADPKVGAVFCEANRVELETGALIRRQPCRPDARGDIRRTLLQRNCVTGSGSAVLARRECFEKAGLFDESLRSCEDWDMWIRISRHFHFDFVPEPLVTLRSHAASMTRRLKTMHDYQMRVIRSAFRDDPVDGSNYLLRHRIMAHFHYDTGEEYLQAHEFGPAVRHLLQSVLMWPFDRRYHTYLARALARKPVAE